MRSISKAQGATSASSITHKAAFVTRRRHVHCAGMGEPVLKMREGSGTKVGGSADRDGSSTSVETCRHENTRRLASKQGWSAQRGIIVVWAACNSGVGCLVSKQGWCAPRGMTQVVLAQALSAQAVLAQAVPAQAVLGQTASAQAVPAQAVSAQAVPSQAVPAQAVLAQAVLAASVCM